MFNVALYYHLAFGVVLTVIAYGVTWLMSRYVRVMDEPNHRSSHVSAIPRAGGVAIVLTFYIGVGATWLLGAFDESATPALIAFIAGTFLIAVISLLDDISEQRASTRLLTQIIAVAIVLYMGIVLDVIAVPFLGSVDLGIFGYVISFFWILGLTNAYNFMDGLDGLAGGVAAIAGLFFMIITFYQGSAFVYVISYSLVAGAVGFLLHNYPPARIILGDVGAAFLGFVFAVLAIIGARYDASHTSFLVIPMLLLNMIYDPALTTLRRLIRGKSIFEPHREFLFQLLNRSGYSHLEVVLTQYCMVFLQGLGALWLVNIPGPERMLVFIPFLLLQVAYTLVVLKRARVKGISY